MRHVPDHASHTHPRRCLAGLEHGESGGMVACGGGGGAGSACAPLHAIALTVRIGLNKPVPTRWLNMWGRSTPTRGMPVSSSVFSPPRMGKGACT